MIGGGVQIRHDFQWPVARAFPTFEMKLLRWHVKPYSRPMSCAVTDHDMTQYNERTFQSSTIISLILLELLSSTRFMGLAVTATDRYPTICIDNTLGALSSQHKLNSFPPLESRSHPYLPDYPHVRTCSAPLRQHQESWLLPQKLHPSALQAL